MENVEMKDIVGYEGLYAATTDGRIWSHRRQKFLKTRVNSHNGGYSQINLHKDGKQRTHSVHRLIAETFIPNPDNKPEVNHKSEIKTDNSVDNLEWVTRIENMNYGTLIQRISKFVYCVELDKTFSSTIEAARETGADQGSICKCCRGQRKTAGGYHWRYAEEV